MDGNTEAASATTFGKAEARSEMGRYPHPAGTQLILSTTSKEAASEILV